MNAGSCAGIVVLAGALGGEGPADVSPLLEGALRASDVPGMTVAVARTEAIIAVGAAGVRRMARDAPVEITDRFHAGGCAEPMSTTLAALLISDRVLRWDMPLSEALPRMGETMNPEHRQITLTALARGYGGLTLRLDDAEPLPSWLRELEGPGRSQREQLADRLLRAVPRAAPERSHSIAGVPILIAICESWTEQSWEQLMARRIFEPLGMTHSGFGWPASAERRDQPRGHARTSRGLAVLSLNAPPALPPALAPAGEVHCSAPDLVRFGALHLAGLRGTLGDDFPLDQDTFRFMHQPGSSGFAMGWSPWEAEGRNASARLGSTGLFVSLLVVDPASDVTVAVCANSGDARDVCERVATALLDRFGPVETSGSDQP